MSEHKEKVQAFLKKLGFIEAEWDGEEITVFTFHDAPRTREHFPPKSVTAQAIYDLEEYLWDLNVEEFCVVRD